jgi:hypothetical protein
MEYSGGGVLSIPELRRAFEHIQSFTAKHLDGKTVNDELVSAFIKEWQRVFHKTITKESARAYLEHMQELGVSSDSSSGKRKRTMKGGRQSGGGANLAGAPLDHTTGPGVYGEYGQFLPYVARGFGVGIAEISQNRPAVPDPSMDVPRDVGSGALLKGGARRSKSSARKTRKQRSTKKSVGGAFITSTNPSTVIQDAISAWRGQQLPNSPAATDPGRNLKLPM